MKRIIGCRFLLLLALLVNESVRASADLCPSSCTCANDGAIVDCSRQGLTRIPSNLPSNTVTLNLSHNNVSLIQALDLSDLRHLKALDLSNNQLSGISEGSFVKLERLEELDLAHNQISCIDRNALASLRSLRYLSLSSNQLSTLPKELIEGTSRLDTLTLDDNPWVCDCRLNWLILWLQSTTRVSRSAASTKIPICMEPIGYQGQRLTSIRPLQCSEGEEEMESAECLPSASWTCPTPCKCSDGIADCRNKKLTHIPSHFPADTTEIRLEQNHIEEVPAKAFVGYKRLRRIDLSNNEIRTLAPDAFRGLKTLTSLVLYMNKIGSLPTQVFHGLTSLQLLLMNSNKIKCIRKDTFRDLRSVNLL